MPILPPRICACGAVVPARTRCECQIIRDRERKARFDRTRPSARARGYDSAWEKARAGFLAKHPRCCRCGAPATVVHHSIPHRGNMALFWNRQLWRPACKPCHDGPLQSLERQPQQ